jgi:hypothetical protein
LTNRQVRSAPDESSRDRQVEDRRRRRIPRSEPVKRSSLNLRRHPGRGSLASYPVVSHGVEQVLDSSLRNDRDRAPGPARSGRVLSRRAHHALSTPPADRRLADGAEAILFTPWVRPCTGFQPCYGDCSGVHSSQVSTSCRSSPGSVMAMERPQEVESRAIHRSDRRSARTGRRPRGRGRSVWAGDESTDGSHGGCGDTPAG